MNYLDGKLFEDLLIHLDDNKFDTTVIIKFYDDDYLLIFKQECLIPEEIFMKIELRRVQLNEEQSTEESFTQSNQMYNKVIFDR